MPIEFYILAAVALSICGAIAAALVTSPWDEEPPSRLDRWDERGRL